MKVTVEVDDHCLDGLRKMIALNSSSGNGTHGPLSIEVLAKMLLEDAGLAITRPGSWEGSKMGALLESHGYTI